MQSLSIPLGMEDFSARNSFLLYEDISQHPSALLWMSARDLARIGLLLLNEGRWEGKSVVSKKWLRESTAVSSELGIIGGYGYSWWAASRGEHFPFVKLPDGSFSGRGTGEQILLMIPEHNTIIVHRGRVCGPGSRFMHVTDFGKLLARILDAKGIEGTVISPGSS